MTQRGVPAWAGRRLPAILFLAAVLAGIALRAPAIRASWAWPDFPLTATAAELKLLRDHPAATLATAIRRFAQPDDVVVIWSRLPSRVMQPAFIEVAHLVRPILLVTPGNHFDHLVAGVQRGMRARKVFAVDVAPLGPSSPELTHVRWLPEVAHRKWSLLDADGLRAIYLLQPE